MNLHEYEWQNRTDEGLELTVDGHGTAWDKDRSFEEYNSTYTTSEALEIEPQLPDEQ